MTTYTYPAHRPSSQTWGLQSFTALHQSPFNGSIDTQDRDGEHWRLRMSYKQLQGDRKAEVMSFLRKLNGAQHRFTMQDFSYSRRGSAGGTPLVKGAAQTGKTLLVDGAPNSITNWLRADDQISIGNQLYVLDEDVDTDGSGNATLTVSPRIFIAPADDASIEIDTPKQLFVMITNYLPALATQNIVGTAFEAVGVPA